MREVFAYYRVRCSDATEFQAAVHSFHSHLTARCPSLRARLLCRADADADAGAGVGEKDGEQTWMEIYATDPQCAPAGVDQAMQAEIERSATALAPWLRSARHTEVFMSLRK